MKTEQIAQAIADNCDRYNAGEMAYDEWGAEQERLWDLCTSERMRVLVLGRLGFNDAAPTLVREAKS